MSRLHVHTHGGVDSCPVHHPVYYEDLVNGVLVHIIYYR